MTDGHGTCWKDARLVALDLEGTGAQDRDTEAILEIAVVPITDGRPSLDDAYTTIINPARPVPRRPWISPGLTNKVLARAPLLAEVEPEVADRLDGRVIVGHNITVDWRLLHRRCPAIQPAGLIDTLRLARQVHPGHQRKSLTALLEQHELLDTVSRYAPGSVAHRALWDTIGAVLLLHALIDHIPDGEGHNLTFAQLRRLAGQPTDDEVSQPDPEQPTLWDI
jgi:DNA polymerase III subunit epsilon